MGTSDTTEADWEEYYRNVNAFNIPNADAKRVEIWDKAFLSTKTVRETLWEVYSKGFMDGVNDTSERFKSSSYKQGRVDERRKIIEIIDSADDNAQAMYLLGKYIISEGVKAEEVR